MNIEAIVSEELKNASTRYLAEIIDHGIHNVSNNFHVETDDDYESFAAEFKRQAEERIHELGIDIEDAR